jgi:HNH endonuclease
MSQRPENNVTADVMAARPLSRRMRYFVLSRDGFRCQYCGATAQQAKLHVDHKIPRARGGADDPDNLITACDDCNLGKWTTLPRGVDPVTAPLRPLAPRRRKSRSRPVVVEVAPESVEMLAPPQLKKAPPSKPPHPLVGCAFLSFLDGEVHWQGEIEAVRDRGSEAVAEARLYSWLTGEPTVLKLIPVRELAVGTPGATYRFFSNHRARNAYLESHPQREAA